MLFSHCIVSCRWILLATSIFLFGSLGASAQNSGLDFSIHANDHADAKSIGLPAYPGATLYKAPDNDAALDIGYSSGDSQFRLSVANYSSSDPEDKILAFYRKPLSRYGEVLECRDGKPVGSLTVTRSGLTCSDEHSGHVEVNAHSDQKGHDLRAGTPRQFRVVGIDKAEPKSTHFALVYVQLPKDDSASGKSR